MTGDEIRVLLVGTGEGFGSDLERDGFEVRRIDLAALGPGSDQDGVIVALDDVGPLEALETLRLKKPAAAVIVLTAAGNEADGAVALHAGADDHLVRGSIADGLLPRAVRYAVERRRMRRELATIDESTRLPNLRGFVAIAEHQLRMADRAGTPLVLLFMRFNQREGTEATPTDVDERAVEASDVLISAIRDADLPARIAEDTFCVLLTGDGKGQRSRSCRGWWRRSRCTMRGPPIPADLAVDRQRDLRSGRSRRPRGPARRRRGRHAPALIREPMTCEYPGRPSDPLADPLEDLPRGGRHERIDDDRPQPERDRALG